MLKIASMKKLMLMTLMGVVASFTQTQAFSADSPLDVIPENVSFVVRVKSPKTLTEKAAKIADAVRPGTGQLVTGQAQSLGMAIANPTLDGVNQDGEFWVAAFLKDEGEPDVVLIIPATDVDEMKDAIDASYDFMAYKSYGLYTQDEGVLQHFRDCQSGTKNALKKIPEGKSSSVFNTGDVNAWINLKEVKTIYKDKIDEGKSEAENGLKQLGQQMEDAQDQGIPGVEGMDFKKIVSLYEKLLKMAIQALEDTETYTISIGVERAGGVNINEYIQVAKDSKTAKAMATLSPTESMTLKQLPKGDMMYVESSANIMQLQTKMIDFAADMMQVTEDKQDDLKAAFKSMKNIKFGNHGISLKLGDIAEGMLRTTVVGNVSPTADFKKTVRSIADIAGNVEVAGMTQTSTIEQDSETYGSEKADVTTVVQNFDMEANPMAMYQQQFIEALYGPNGIVSRTIYQSDKYIQTSGGGKERMEESLKAATNSDSLSGDSALVRDRKALPEKTDLIFLTDIPNMLVTFVTKVLESGMVPLPIDPTPLTELEMKQSYAGWSMTSDDRGIHLRTNVPMDTLENFGKIVNAAMQMQQNLQQF